MSADKHTLSVRTACQGRARQMRGPSSLPASTAAAAAAASKQAGQVLLRLEQHQGLICVYSTQHLQHNPAGNHGDGTVTSERIKEKKKKNQKWRSGVFVVHKLRKKLFLISPLHASAPICSDQPTFSVAVRPAALWGFCVCPWRQQTLHLDDAPECVTVKPQVLCDTNRVCLCGRSAAPLRLQQSLGYRAAIEKSLGRAAGVSMTPFVKFIVIISFSSYV